MELTGDATKNRFVSAIIDNIIGLAMMFLVVSAIPENLTWLRALMVVLGYLGYFFLLEWLWGRTLGKFWQGLTVKTLDGSKAGIFPILIRTITRVVEVNPALFGALPAGLILIASERKQRLGDMLAGTVVIPQKPSEE